MPNKNSSVRDKNFGFLEIETSILMLELAQNALTLSGRQGLLELHTLLAKDEKYFTFSKRRFNAGWSNGRASFWPRRKYFLLVELCRTGPRTGYFAPLYIQKSTVLRETQISGRQIRGVTPAEADMESIRSVPTKQNKDKKRKKN
jgi:hypothetical protein